MDKEHILYLMNKALETQLEIYSPDDMVDDIDDLTDKDKRWALDNIGFRAFIHMKP